MMMTAMSAATKLYSIGVVPFSPLQSFREYQMVACHNVALFGGPTSVAR